MLQGRTLTLSLLAAALAAPPLAAGPRPQEAGGWRASHVIVPQTRAFPLERGGDPIEIEGVEARVEILGQTATTTLEIAVRNPSGRPAEAALLLPVPDEAAVGSFLFEGAAAEPTAELLPADEARRTYDSIVAKIQDPALLEFAGYNLIRSSVFPVPAGGTQRVRLSYEHLLERDGDRIDYVLPRSESLAVLAPWRVSVELRASQPISAVYSPSHDLETASRTPRSASVRVAQASSANPGPFRLSYLLQSGAVSASLFAYPDAEDGGGYFLLMAGLPASVEDADRVVRREVTVVLDRSGSMAGEKFDQARAAALQVLEGLDAGEAFHLVDYSDDVARFAPGATVKSAASMTRARDYLASLKAVGGTNLHGALLEALRPEPAAGMLPLVLFLSLIHI